MMTMRTSFVSGNWRFALAGVALSSLTFACSPPPTGEGEGEGTGGAENKGTGGDVGESPAGFGDAMGSTGEQITLIQARTTCETSQVGPAVLNRLTQAEVDASLRDIFSLAAPADWGNVQPGEWTGVKLSPDPSSKLGFTNDASVLVVGGTTAKEMLRTAEDVADRVVAKLDVLLPCASSAPDRACVEGFVSKYGRRLFRRPLEDADVARYADFHESVAGRSDFNTGLKWMVTSMVQSPYAFYRSEIGAPTDSGRVLDDYEMASELSYMMTGSTPDDALLDAAESGRLSDPATRREEAARLLSSAHPRFLDGMRTFFNEWLRYRTVLGQSRDDDPTFAEEISPLMVAETRLFLDTLVFDAANPGTIRDLMTANFTALNSRLASFYGMPGPAGADFERVARPAEFGMGVLAQGSLLASRSHQSETSPTLRALLFTGRFLCMEKPLPPAVVPTIEESNEGKPATTTREKYEINHGTGACGTCHLQFEPYGYTMEHFDEMGVWRDDEAGAVIDTSVTNAPLPDGSTVALSDLDELALMVDVNDEVENCISGLLTAYMYSGAGGTPCLAEAARTQAASGELSIYDLLLALTEADHFSRRL